MTKPNEEVLIVGGGLAGLTCANNLHAAGIPVRLFEASDGLGGRVRTDTQEGFLLDRGFQVLLTAYPETRRALDYQALHLKPFFPGAFIWADGKFHRLADPWRRPQDMLRTALSAVGTLGDKLRVGRLRARVARGAARTRRPEIATQDYLREDGFSEQMIERFFRPFFGGVFLDRDLTTSSSMLEFVFDMFARGTIAIPALGMGQIPEQLAKGVPAERIELHTPVESIEDTRVRLTDGQQRSGLAVVVATDEPVAYRLVPESRCWGSPRLWRGTTCLYFAAERPPIDEPVLLLNGTGSVSLQTGPVNNLCVISNVAPQYAPPGASLISATVVGNPSVTDAVLVDAARDQLKEWFGHQVEAWRLLRVDRIVHALPGQDPPRLSSQCPSEVRPGVFVCGDHTDTSSINGAMRSGREVAELIKAKYSSGE